MNLNEITKRLQSCDFKRQRGAFVRDDLQAKVGARWLSLSTDSSADGVLIGPPGSALGLWKTIRTAGDKLKRVFDVPLAIFAHRDVWDEESGDAVCPVGAVIDWASATKSAQPNEDLDGWSCPSREALEETLPKNAFTVESGKIARQAILHCQQQRLSISLPLATRVPAELAPRRRELLNKLLADVHNRTRVVRLVEESGEQNSISAEVELTGVPHFAAPLLVRVGLDAVRHIVTQSMSTIDVLVDPSVTSTDWETPLEQASACGKD